MGVSKEELGDALQNIAEYMLNVDNQLAKLGAGLTAVKAALAIQMNPTDPKTALAQIQQIEDSLSQIDKTAPARKQAAEVIEILKLVGKHGGPKQA
jgi:hypothetical protein